MIEGKITEDGRDPFNVQVVVKEGEDGGILLQLQDAEGVFLEADPPMEEEETEDVPQQEAAEQRENAEQEEDEESLKAKLDEVVKERDELKEALKTCKERLNAVWKANCAQLREFEEALKHAEDEARTLQKGAREKQQEARSTSPSGSDISEASTSKSTGKRVGKAPPIDSFSGDCYEVQLDDWLPSLERAAEWNRWSLEEKLMQLAGHLRGKALQEWTLISETERTTYVQAVAALRTRLDTGSKTLAAQDFRHLCQDEKESVSEYIRKLERTFRVAYGRDNMSQETRDTLLLGQMQEGLKHEVMKAPAVSGATSYKELCVAAKNEERRLKELQKREHYDKIGHPTPREPTRSNVVKPAEKTNSTRRCFKCHKDGHIARDCPGPEPESRSSGRSLHKQDGVRKIKVTDSGSKTHCVRLEVQKVPVYGLIDSGSDITIIGSSLFKRVAAVARLKKGSLMTADKTPRTYDQKTFSLDGRIDLELSFEGKSMKTPVYLKNDAHDQLLLSEGVCRQLGIITYHHLAEPWRGSKKADTRKSKDHAVTDAKVPRVVVNLVQSLHLPSYKSVVVPVQVSECTSLGAVLFEENSSIRELCGVIIVDSLIRPDGKGIAHVVAENRTGYTARLERGAEIGTAFPATVVKQTPSHTGGRGSVAVNTLKSVTDSTQRKARLKDMLDIERSDIMPAQKAELVDMLLGFHNAFSLSEEERGETDLIQMTIDTGTTQPRKSPLRRMPLAVRAEVARQVEKMQEMGVVTPSSSPWSSPVVLVRKKDGAHRFCVDYRGLNEVTKADGFPLPRVDDLLDQLGLSRYFSTLDLAAGFWQIRMHPDSKEKTAFATPQGLFEFQVMPFGLMNSPAVFQRLMQQVLAGLNPAEGPEFVSVYIDDILIFSANLEDHIGHLKLVLERITQANLKLKPSKCHFIRKEVEYLGHVITPEGLRTNQKLVQAVQEFPTPKDLSRVRQYLGMCSYYRRFIPHFATIAKPLHILTRKGAEFEWTAQCEDAFQTLKTKLLCAPVLAYPDMTKPFVLETDASGSGVGAVLSQSQDDGTFHPVAYASRSLTRPESNYGITELETLAVVWALTHFRGYLYGNSVTVYTDHAAVKAVLETPNPSGKHARWWSKVYESGVKSISIIYKSGKSNTNADALSRNPVGPATQQVEEVQVAAIQTDGTVAELLAAEPQQVQQVDFREEQKKDPHVMQTIRFLEEGELPQEEKQARKLALQAPMFAVTDGILYYVETKGGVRRVVLPKHLQRQLVEESHGGRYAGHFCGPKVYSMLAKHWWWEGMYTDVLQFCRSCPECAIATGGGRPVKPLLSPIPVQRPFQIFGVDLMELPATSQGNKYVVVFQDFFSKWPLVFPVPDQKSERIVKLLADEIIPFCGVPEALLSDRGTNLLSHLMLDVCRALGIQKLNTTAYHPQCDGMVERFNRTLKTALRKHAAKFGNQWDRYLSGVLWAYRNTPHDSTGEKPSYLLFGIDCRAPLESSLLPVENLTPSSVSDYREELLLSLSSARKLACDAIQKAQCRYKKGYDKHARPTTHKIGDWILIKFPHEESGKNRKLSRPWHGPYRLLSCTDTDVVAAKVYFPDEGHIQVHQNRTTICPRDFPNGYYWYGKSQSSNKPCPQWLDAVLGSVGRPDEGTTDSQQANKELQDQASTEAAAPSPTTEDTSTDVSVENRPPRERTGRYSLREKIRPPRRYLN
eukprot:Em0001g8a